MGVTYHNFEIKDWEVKYTQDCHVTEDKTIKAYGIITGEVLLDGRHMNDIVKWFTEKEFEEIVDNEFEANL